jgi:hypothetical protein
VAGQLSPAFTPYDPPREDSSAEDFTQQRGALDTVMHQLYRQLARLSHPDVNPAAPPHVMVRINAAYQNRELGSLMLLARDAAHEIDFSFDDMVHYHDSLHALSTDMQQQIEALRTSDANRLRTRLLIARLNGDDVIADVAKALQRGENGMAA